MISLRVAQLSLVFIALLLTACANDNNEISADARAALQKLANSVNTFSINGASASAATSRSKSTSLARSIDNTEQESGSDEFGTYTIDMEYFAADATTPITSEEALTSDSYVMKITSLFRNDQYESNTSQISTIENIENERIPNYTSTGTGSVNYYNDNLLLTADSIFVKVNARDGFYLRYEMSFLDHKYSFTLEATLDIDEILEAENETIYLAITSKIYDADNNHVGYFILNEDESVVIKDKAGEVIQSAG